MIEIREESTEFCDDDVDSSMECDDITLDDSEKLIFKSGCVLKV